jgi:hypothetical protein
MVLGSISKNNLYPKRNSQPQSEHNNWLWLRATILSNHHTENEILGKNNKIPK